MRVATISPTLEAISALRSARRVCPPTASERRQNVEKQNRHDEEQQQQWRGARAQRAGGGEKQGEPPAKQLKQKNASLAENKLLFSAVNFRVLRVRFGDFKRKPCFADFLFHAEPTPVC